MELAWLHCSCDEFTCEFSKHEQHLRYKDVQVVSTAQELHISSFHEDPHSYNFGIDGTASWDIDIFGHRIFHFFHLGCVALVRWSPLPMKNDSTSCGRWLGGSARRYKTMRIQRVTRGVLRFFSRTVSLVSQRFVQHFLCSCLNLYDYTDCKFPVIYWIHLISFI